MFTSNLVKSGKFEAQSGWSRLLVSMINPIYLALLSITESPVSIAAHGIVSSSRGLSLRFPRFIRTRDDKHIEMANTPLFLADIWRSQQGKTDMGNDDGELIDVQAESSEAEDAFEEDESA